MNKAFRYLLLAGLPLLLIACSGRALHWSPDYHTVRSGETLYSIALAYSLNYQDLARWNGLGDGTLIREGQRLRLSPQNASRSSTKPAPLPSMPAATEAQPDWRWPAEGEVYLRFGESPKTGSGIRITGKEGQPIRAVASGEVVYAGSGLASYGQLLIIKHNDSWLSAYGFNRALLVAEGQHVTASQNIALMGKDAAGTSVLHFEIRKNGQPVDPLRYLPAR